MICPACGHDVPAGSAFCNGCGAKLVRTCASCGTTPPQGSRFCNGCGADLQAGAPSPPAATPASIRDPRRYTPRHLAEKILTSRSALEGERKQVTVLFADVKGSIDLAEQVDPEEWHKIMDRFFAILSDGVHRFEGTINQYTGDGIMALFGAPIAHEDHAQRACYAVLHLQQELQRYGDEICLKHGLNFSVRMGLNSGEVVVGKIGDDLRMDYTAQGHTVGLAARMEQMANPGKALLAGDTARLVSGYFSLRALGETQIKGLTEPFPVFELEGLGQVRTRLDLSRARGFTRFVGRASEMAVLEAALERAVAGSGQVVGVVADPGLGKSRLCAEFAERCRAREIRVYEARGVAHGKGIPWLPILESLRGYFGIIEQDSPRAARDKIAGRMLLLDGTLADGLPFMFDFLAVPDPERPVPPLGPEARQKQFFDVMRRLARARSAREPAVHLWEDLHWFDRASLEFIESLVEISPANRTLVLLNFRPEFRASWMQRSYCQQLPLLPLGSEAIQELLGDLLGTDSSLRRLIELIRERTGGNPFFIEEIVQALAETGALLGKRGAHRIGMSVEEIGLPATVQSVLAARIDRLPEREKRLLQRASVIGKNFSEPILRRVADLGDGDLAGTLHALMDAEFIYEEALYPQAEYAFKHPLTQDVAYGSQLGDHRSQMHAAVASAIAELHPAELDERAALVALHWERAGELARAAEWHRRAALWAGQQNLAEAARHWQKVRTLAAGLPESAETVLLVLEASRELLNAAWRTGMSDAEADVLFAESRALAERTGDLRSRALLTNFYSSIKMSQGDARNMLAHALEAVRLAEQTGDPLLIGALHDFVITAYAHLGPLALADQGYKRASDLLRNDPTAGVDFYGISPLLNMASAWQYALVSMGRFEEAAHEVKCARELAKQHRGLDVLCYIEAIAVYLARLGGNVVRPLDHARAAVELADKAGNAFAVAFANWALGMAHALAEEWPPAIRAFESALMLTRDHRTWLIIEPTLLAYLAESYAGAGETQLARARAEEALALAQQRETRIQEIDAQLALVRVRRRGGISARTVIEAALGRVLALVRETGARGFEPHVHLERAELHRLTGDVDAGKSELTKAHRLFVEMGATGHADSVAKELRL
jgi:class 3 adenylate cyclase/tetratricopeptide (TPR) repeat protein